VAQSSGFCCWLKSENGRLRG